MNSAPAPVKGATAACILIFLTATLWVLGGYVWPTLSNFEVATLQAQLDPRLFHGDYSVQEALGFTPRFYFNQLILLPTRVGLPLAWAFAAWHLIALAVFIAGVRSLFSSLGGGAVAGAVLLTWLLMVGIGTVGMVFFYYHAPVPAVWASAAVVAGAACAVRGRSVAAYAWFGGAVLLQFLVGFYAGLLALPLLLRRNGRQRMFAIGLWLFGLALVYGPMRYTGNTDAGLLDNAAFVNIYGQIHLPHHLVPTSWGWPIWVQATVFYAGAWWFLHRTAEGRPSIERLVIHYTLGLTVLALALNYIFVELYPLALVAKLQPARITPLAQAVILTLLALRIHARGARGDWLGATLLAIIPLSLFPGALLLLAAVLIPPPNAKSKFPWQTLVLAFAVLLSFQLLDSSLANRTFRYGLCAAIFLVQLLPRWLAKRPWQLGVATALVVGGATCAAWASFRPDWPPFLVQRFAIDARPLDPEGILGRRFGAHSPFDAIVLLPPGGDAWSFKLHARRAVVVDTKSTPFTDRGLLEWKSRMEAVLGVPLIRHLDPFEAWRVRTPEQLRTVAVHYGARYVLTRDDWHPQLPGHRIDQEQGWTLWQLD